MSVKGNFVVNPLAVTAPAKAITTNGVVLIGHKEALTALCPVQSEDGRWIKMKNEN